MKANKILACALAALALVGFSSCDTTKENQPLELSDTQLTLNVGETHQITATAGSVETWESNKPEVATVANGLVTAVAEGTAIITAKAGAESKSCVVKVTKAGSQGSDGKATIQASEVWAIVMDQVTFEANQSIMKGDARVDDVENHLYIWSAGETYAAGDGVGRNYFGNDEGYVALTVAAPAQWSGLGFCITKAESVAALEALRQAILKEPDQYFFHLALKSTDNAYHQFYVFNEGVNSFAIGSQTVEAGEVVGDFTRDGKWYGFDIPMSKFTAGIQKPFESGHNIFCALSGNQVGAQLNLDACYFYKK